MRCLPWLGACATATHGSGDQHGNLATNIAAIEFVAANGERVSLARGDADFDGAVVNMGALGIVSKITLDIEPTYDIQQYVYLDLPVAQLYDHLDDIMASAYSVSMFTDWQNDTVNQVWLKQRIENDTLYDAEPEFYGAVLSAEDMRPAGGGRSANPCSEQRGIRGAWHERLPHFKLDFVPTAGNELQTEYYVPRENAVEALRRLHGLREGMAPLLTITEYRSVAADTLWMSSCYEMDVLAIHFSWKGAYDDVMAFLPTIESQIIPLDARPHWGKLFTMSPDDFLPHFPRLKDFRRLVQKHDPNGKFHNAFLQKNIF